MLILTISGSLREGSYNTMLLECASQLTDIKTCDVSFKHYSDLDDIEPFNQDSETQPSEAVQDLRQQISTADGILIASPEYNGSVPGQLKNVLDWVSRPPGDSVLKGKPVAVITASISQFAGAGAGLELRKVLGRIGACVVTEQFALAKADQHVVNGNLQLSQNETQQLRELVIALLSAAESN